MEEISTENVKISDSGYSNTCSNSQSHRSSDSSRSRNSNRSASSGYGGGQPSTFDSRNETGLQPTKRKDKEHKKKKSKTSAVVSSAANVATEIDLKTAGPSTDISTYVAAVPTKTVLEKEAEVATVELVDATDPGEHNGVAINDAEAELASPAKSLDDSISQANDGFCAVISMRDGRVLYTTPSICTALGYPRESWIGQSFIDYVHPTHKATLTEQITRGVALPEDDRPKGLNGRRASLFCGLQKNSKSGLCSTSNSNRNPRSNQYLPFHLTLTFRDLKDRAADQQRRAMFLVVTAQPVHSAYKAPEETIISSIFTTRHTASCYLSHVDPDVVQYFGYLPQDMVGRSLFDFYHPEDLPFIKDIYETVIKLEGSSFRSKPYRFAVHNGGYVVLDTEWSSFVNPWTRKLEFVIGQHRVLKGPPDPDVFRAPSVELAVRNIASISEEVLKESKVIEDEIRAILNETIQRKSDIGENDVLKRCKDLASFMENLLQEMKGPCHGKDPAIADDRSFSEHDSVMLGEISPHHEYYDSKSSTETPPSYNQLNYNENIQRFFKSKPPVATMYGSDEEIVVANDEGGKNSPNSGARKCMSPINGSGASGSGSAENLSSGSNNQTSSGSRGEGSNSNSSFKPPTLTTTLLNRHNEDMEKLMMQKHRELRSSIKNNDKLKDSRIKPTAEKMITDQNSHYVGQSHGVKRCGSHSWEGDSHKISKHDDVLRTSASGQVSTNVTTTVTSMSIDQTSTGRQTNANVNLWPPIPAAIPAGLPAAMPSMPPPSAHPFIAPTFQTDNSQAIPRIPVVPSMIPVYYVPVPQDRTTTDTVPQDNRVPQSTSHPTPQNPYMFVPVSYVATTMAGVIYPPMMAAPTPGMMYRPFVMPEQTATPREKPQMIVSKQSDRKRAASQATSVKAEPGSIMSDSSKKILSPREMYSSCLSNDGRCSSVVELSTVRNTAGRRQNDYNGDESSSSSFYSSFLNRSSDCSCNPDQRTSEPSTEVSSNACAQLHMKDQQQGMRKKEPPWMEDVQLTPELIYEYQLRPKTLNEVLQSDMETLKKLNQPLLVNDQLGQLYLDLELDGFETKLILEDGITSSGSESGSSTGSWNGATSQQRKQGHRMLKYGKLVMIHEENAPFPPPQVPTSSSSSSSSSSSRKSARPCQTS